MLNVRSLELKERLILGLAAAALALLFMPRPTHAFTISPPVLDFTLNPGDTLSDVVQVYNDEQVAFKITPVAVNFYAKAGDETSGVPEFYPRDEVRTGYEVAPWITIGAQEPVMQPGQRLNYPITIKVPKDAQPGSHFGAVQLLVGKPDDVNSPDHPSVDIERGTSVMVFVRVSGNARDEMSVSRFSGDQGSYSHLPVTFHIRLDNTGTTHMRPTGDIFVKDMFGRQVASVLVNPGPDFKTVLPGTSRRFDADWVKTKLPDGTSEFWQQVKNFGFGKYEATLVLNYGPNNAIMTSTWSFWVLPWLAIATIAGVILVLILALVFGMRWYNHLVIRSYEAKKMSK